jgi:2-polyprenyl-3-methyl-5-hydroxy-6-metoxy-1,4-benzoquinol methylase
MPDFAVRSTEVEIMDDLNCSGAVVNQTLEELEFINKWLGGNVITIQGVKALLKNFQAHGQQSLVVADLGCGSGSMLRILAKHFFKTQINGIGIDANPNIIEYARQKSLGYNHLKYLTLDVHSDEFKKNQYDIILATLFLHHFSSSQLIEVFTSLKKQARVGVVINDLHRHWLAYYFIKILTRLFSKSAMVKFDAPLSVLRGFRREELTAILTQAGIKKYTLKWRWAFRWQLIIFCS